MAAVSLACNRCSLNVCDCSTFSWRDDISAHTHLFSWNQIEFLLFQSCVHRTQLNWRDVSAHSYDSDSPKSLMFKNSPPAQGCIPSSWLRVSRVFLYQETFSKLSCNWDKLGLCSPASPVGVDSLQEQGMSVLISLTPESHTGHPPPPVNRWLLDDREVDSSCLLHSFIHLLLSIHVPADVIYGMDERSSTQMDSWTWDLIQFPSPTKGKTSSPNPRPARASSTYLQPREFMRQIANHLFGRLVSYPRMGAYSKGAPTWPPFPSLEPWLLRYG